MDRLGRLLYLVAGVLVLWWLANRRIVDRHLNRLIRWALRRWTDLDVRDYASLLNLSDDYSVRELGVQEGDWLSEKLLEDCRLTEEGVIVLGIYRNDGSYVGAPKQDTKIYEDDTLILYGHEKVLENLHQRAANTVGDEAHRQAVTDQRKRMSDQEVKEAEYQKKRKTQARARYIGTN
jgi:hypothetical protein